MGIPNWDEIKPRPRKDDCDSCNYESWIFPFYNFNNIGYVTHINYYCHTCITKWADHINRLEAIRK